MATPFFYRSCPGHSDMRPLFLSKKNFYLVLGLLALTPALTGITTPENRLSHSDVPVNIPIMQSVESPWPPEISHLRERLQWLGLPLLREEGTIVHTHQHLTIYIHGKNILVPAGIGIHPKERFISIIHTHDSTGMIHIESPVYQGFMLGQFFYIWGIWFNSNCIGHYCEDQQNGLRVFVNGKAISGDPRFIRLTDRMEIVISFGALNEIPNPIPETFPAWLLK